jgi:hypothetical protein
LIDAIVSVEFWGVPVWIVALGVIIVSLEARRLVLLRQIRPADDTPHAGGRALGQKLGVSIRFLIFAVLAGMLCLRVTWAGIPLAALLVHTSLRPAWEYAIGFATGVAESSGRKPSTALAALLAVGYIAFGRGLLAFLAVLASFAQRGAAP